MFQVGRLSIIKILSGTWKIKILKTLGIERKNITVLYCVLYFSDVDQSN